MLCQSKIKRVAEPFFSKLLSRPREKLVPAILPVPFIDITDPSDIAAHRFSAEKQAITGILLSLKNDLKEEPGKIKRVLDGIKADMQHADQKSFLLKIVHIY